MGQPSIWPAIAAGAAFELTGYQSSSAGLVDYPALRVDVHDIWKRLASVSLEILDGARDSVALEKPDHVGLDDFMAARHELRASLAKAIEQDTTHRGVAGVDIAANGVMHEIGYPDRVVLINVLVLREPRLERVAPGTQHRNGKTAAKEYIRRQLPIERGKVWRLNCYPGKYAGVRLLRNDELATLPLALGLEP